MSVRFNTLTNFFNRQFVKKTLFFLLLVVFCPIVYTAQVTIEEVKKKADKLFEEQEFTLAYTLYSQLVSNFPKDPEYNYRLGVCMIYSEPDKKKCIPYLKTAASNQKESPKDVNFYLGKAYHINYYFDNEFKKTASSSQQKKLQVDKEIKACNNGKRLLSNMSDLVVQNKKSLNEADYFRSYDLKTIGGKLLVKPDEFRSNVDKKKKEKSVVFLPKGSNVVYYSSYGDNPATGKDIYTVAKLPSGEFGKPQKVAVINTEFDEDYPFLHPDGKTLYFASKGHNSMGGYDIFKSVYSEETNSWSVPENMEFPINSPDDDFLFVTDSLESTAYFSTGRQSEPGKIDVLKIKTERKPIDVLVIKGKVLKENDAQSILSNITVKNTLDDNIVGVFEANDKGEYNLELPNGAKLIFTVVTPGLNTQSETVELPLAKTARPYKQTIGYQDGVLKIFNLFDESVTDDSYLQYLKLIEKKAKLDVNEGENKLQSPSPTLVSEPLATSTTTTLNPKVKRETKAQIIGEETNTAVATTNPTPAEPKSSETDSKQLSQIADQDAEELMQEAAQINKDALDAIETSRKLKTEADKKLTEANEGIKAAESISDENEKKAILSKAIELKKQAENDQVIANRIDDFAKSLQEDAKNKEKEAQLTKNYAKELEGASKSKNKTESLAKLEEFQKQIKSFSNQKNGAEAVVNTIKSDIEQKEGQIATQEKINSDIKANLNEITTAITEKESEKQKTKKKALKLELDKEIETLTKDKVEKETQLITKETELIKLNDELNTLKNELDLTNKIKTEEIVITNTLANIPATSAIDTKTLALPTATSATISSEKVTANALQKKYTDKLISNDTDNKTALEENISHLNDFNKELDKALTENKTRLNKTKNQKQKQDISAEISQLEKFKRQNQQQLAAKTTNLNQLTNNLAQTNPASSTNTQSISTYEPITAANATEAVAKLESLEKQLKFDDNYNFEYNGYKNPKAQAQKIEADARINDAVAKQKKLREQIQSSKTNLASNSSGNGSVNTTITNTASILQLNTEADDLHNEALKKLSEAKTKDGADKQKLIDESRELEEKSNVKHLEVSEITKRENDQSFDTNKENIINLIKENKNNPTEVSEINRLSDEATTAFKKAKEIRAEIGNESNSGAKLGAISNAEEKEAEAILKQQQAIELLKKSNPDFVLKTIANTTAPNSDNNAAVVNSGVEEVNTSLTELATIKLDSYKKLNEANTTELEELDASIKLKETVLNSNPSLKTDYLAATKKLDDAKKLMQNSESASKTDEKLNNLIASIKKQNEAIKQLDVLNTALLASPAVTANEPVAASNTNTSTPESGTLNSTNTTTVEGSTTTNPVNSNSSNNPAAITENSLATITETDQPVKTAAPPSNDVIKEFAKNDTTTGQVISYFDESNIILKNPQADTQLKKSLNQLKNYEADIKSIETKLNQTETGSENAGAGGNENSKDLKTKSDALMVEADEISTKAFALRKEAAKKEGTEEETMMTEVRELEAKSLDKNIEAAVLLFRANELNVAANNAAIDELLPKLRSDNPELSVELASKRDELNGLRTQVLGLRNEAETQETKSAKLGAINNAQERESELLQKQEAILAEFKKIYPDFVVKPVTEASLNAAPALSTEKLIAGKKEIRTKQFSELTNLTNALSLEFESLKNAVPTKLDAEGQTTKQKALELNAESKRLLIKSAQTTNEGEKLKLLSRSGKLGSEAITELSKLNLTSPATIIPPVKEDEPVVTAEVTNSTTITPPATTTPKKQKNTKTNPVVKTTPETANSKSIVSIEGLEVKQGNAYTDARPIPMNAKIEDGLIFRVQIGAFKTQIPNNAFKGLNPLNGETTANGYFRYTAGNFNKYELANAVKNDLRTLGYSDAFVVAYFNGKRVTLGEAIDLMSKEGKTIDPNAPQTAGITANSNIPKASQNPVLINEKAVPSKELENVNGLLFTIQIGVFNRQVNSNQLRNLRPIFTEQIPGGLFRYTAGIYNNIDRLRTDKAKVVALGLSDAFASAYLNGKKITFAEATKRQTEDSTVKMQTEDPIIFSGSGAANPPAATNNQVNTPSPAFQPFSNGVSSYPTPTADNGVKGTEEGVCFKVQIGAFSKQVPNDVAAKLQAIKTWPVDNKSINGLYIYNIGNFSEARYAKVLRDEALRLGLTGSFITVYKDGKKLYGAEAAALMNR